MSARSVSHDMDSSQEDRHFSLCQALVQERVRQIVLFSRDLESGIHARLRSSGAEIEAVDYGPGVFTATGCWAGSRRSSRLPLRTSCSSTTSAHSSGWRVFAAFGM
jgi:hypothetical protein